MVANLCDEMIEQLPHLRAFARMIARDRVLADDLVQETMLRALLHADQFEPGTNLKAWLTTILRNAFFNEKRRERQAAQLPVIVLNQPTAMAGEQDARLALRDFEQAFADLPAPQREALSLVGISGIPYDEAAHAAGCSIGTLKSRASRARAYLRRRLDMDEVPANDEQPGREVA